MTDEYELPYFGKKKLLLCPGKQPCKKKAACKVIDSRRVRKNPWTGRILRKTVKAKLKRDCAKWRTTKKAKTPKWKSMDYWNYNKEQMRVELSAKVLREHNVQSIGRTHIDEPGAYWTVYKMLDDKNKVIKIRVLFTKAEYNKALVEQQVYEVAARRRVGPHVSDWFYVEGKAANVMKLGQAQKFYAVAVAIVGRYDSIATPKIRSMPEYKKKLADLRERIDDMEARHGIVNKDATTARNILVKLRADKKISDIVIGDWGSFTLRRGHSFA